MFAELSRLLAVRAFLTLGPWRLKRSQPGPQEKRSFSISTSSLSSSSCSESKCSSRSKLGGAYYADGLQQVNAWDLQNPSRLREPDGFRGLGLVKVSALWILWRCLLHKPLSEFGSALENKHVCSCWPQYFIVASSAFSSALMSRSKSIFNSAQPRIGITGRQGDNLCHSVPCLSQRQHEKKRGVDSRYDQAWSNHMLSILDRHIHHIRHNQARDEKTALQELGPCKGRCEHPRIIGGGTWVTTGCDVWYIYIYVYIHIYIYMFRICVYIYIIAWC